MNTNILISNLTNPVLLFFILGVLATIVKSDLEIPAASAKFISLYLLFSIGFRGGQELVHSGINEPIIITLALALLFSIIVPIYVFYLLRWKLNVSDAGAVASAYGSVSAVTFISAASFLEMNATPYGGHMVAAMAMMEAPAIVVGMILIRKYEKNQERTTSFKTVLHDAFTNGSVWMILGSLFIGLIADTKQAEGIKPFTSDIFKGFLAIFLLEMGMVAAKRFKAFIQYGWFVTIISIIIPLFNGFMAVWVSSFWHIDTARPVLTNSVSCAGSGIFFACSNKISKICAK
ncbi:MAG: sodium-dependent bicarbonate transport family permease, partial [Chitinophagaceae bacterium]|nr:sodium-dependent bicarbonate transport family permease [Chitinophagaceae bacterium]